MATTARDQRETRKNGHYATGEVSVTTVLGCLNKPALTHWLCKKTFEAAKDGAETYAQAQKQVRAISTEAKDTGSGVHKYIENYCLEKHCAVDPKLIKYYQAFHDWWIDYQPHIISVETTVTSSLGYKGTLDLVVELEGKRYIVDVKTGKGIYPSVTLQASAYRQALEEQGEEIDGMYCLLLEKGGDGYPTGRYQFKKLKYVPEVFNSLLAVYQWRHG